MKKLLILIFVLFVSVFAYAYDWESVGPSDLQVNNFNTVFYNMPIEILCVSDGILINEGGNWVEYPYYGLPAWSAVGLDPNNILVFIGDGSWSDGVYKFNLTSHQYEVVTYHPFPNFLQFCETNNTYYAGALYGILESTDGLIWTPIDCFKQKNCIAFAYYENHLVVVSDDGIYISPDNGTTWNLVQYTPFISDMSFRDNGTLYGIFPNTSFSSGLWKSINFGESWYVEFWSTYMSSVGIDVDGNIFTGWEEEGIAHWDPASQELTFFNDGLPNLYINKITYNPLLECVNIVCCTDNGAYMLTNYTVGIEEDDLKNQNCILNNYPNPFNSSTTISFNLIADDAKIEIYNIKGQKVKQFEIQNLKSEIHKVVWDGTDDSGKPVGSGIYFYNLRTGNKFSETKRMLLLK